MILKLGIFLVAVGLIKFAVSLVMRHKKGENDKEKTSEKTRAINERCD